MERREFLRTSCNLCLSGAAVMVLPGLTACSPASYNVYKTNIVDRQLHVPLDLFSKSPFQVVRPKGWYYDIAVTKKEDNTYEENQLTLNGNGYRCSLHGSQFDKNGKVTKGPAELPLERYQTHLTNNELVIEIRKTS